MDVLVSNYNNQGGKVVKNLTPFFYSFEAQVDGLSAFNGKVVGSRPTGGTKHLVAQLVRTPEGVDYSTLFLYLYKK